MIEVFAAILCFIIVGWFLDQTDRRARQYVPNKRIERSSNVDVVRPPAMEAVNPLQSFDKYARRCTDVKRPEFTSRGEVECARVLKVLFPQHSFIKVRPSWQPNDYAGRNHSLRYLELDLYCETLKLAVEYNGRQHYEVVPAFHSHPSDRFLASAFEQQEAMRKRFWGQTQRDQRKLDNCAKRGVDLIVVKFDDPRTIENILRTHPLILKHRPSALPATAYGEEIHFLYICLFVCVLYDASRVRNKCKNEKGDRENLRTDRLRDRLRSESEETERDETWVESSSGG